MIDQFQFFKGSLVLIKRRTIKIKERKLYSNQRENVTMRVTNEKSVLTNVFYVFNLDVNLLFEKKLCVNDLKKNFDENELYLHDNKKKQMFKTSNQRNFYLINKISSQLSKYVLITSIIFKIIVMSILIDFIFDDEMSIDQPDEKFMKNDKIASRSFADSTNLSLNKDLIDIEDSSSQASKIETYKL